MGLLSALDEQQVAVFDTFVVPRFLAMFAAIALDMIVPCEGAVVANVNCRSGFPDQLLSRMLPSCTLVGFDPCEAALSLARTKAALLPALTVDYRLAQDAPLPVPSESFSHVLALYPGVEPSRRAELIAELARIAAPDGQVILAMPLRGSYQEVTDLLREYALKHDASDVAKAVEASVMARPTVEALSEELEAAGLDDIDIEVKLMTLPFRSGGDFLQDPITRLMVLRDLEMALGIADLGKPMAYVREAVDRYWAESEFELSVNVGCASARKLMEL